jgi:PAS domain S-box-containing protein
MPIDPKDIHVLRQKAEKALSEAPEKLALMSGVELQGLFHELSVHQIELEMQNEELRRSRELLEESRREYAELYDFAPLGYLTFDNRGIITRANLTSCRLFGFERTVFIKRPFTLFIHPEFQDLFYFHTQKVLETTTTQTCELALKRKNETFFNAQLQSITVQINGQPAVNAIVIDITERKQVEEALKRASRELNEAKNEVDRIVERRTAQLSESNKLLRQEIAARKTTEEKLKKSRERLRRLSVRSRRLREEERAFLSRELHDELGQVLTGIKMDVAWIGRRTPEGNALIVERLNSILTHIDDAILSVQGIALALRPPALDNSGLQEVMRLAAEDFEKRTKIACEIISKPQHIRLKKDICTEAFRIFQEALTNISRHAGAQSVSVSLGSMGDKFIMEVRDDGKGITERQISGLKSIGLTGMRERAHSVGGSLTITGTRGKGTTITLSVPLDKKTRHNTAPEGD